MDEILERRRGGDLFRYLLEKFASFSGISGVQPKILVRDEKAFAEMEHTGGHRLSQSHKGATHIVKLWEPNEYPQLAANEYFSPDPSAQIRTRRAPLSPGRGRLGAGH